MERRKKHCLVAKTVLLCKNLFFMVSCYQSYHTDVYLSMNMSVPSYYGKKKGTEGKGPANSDTFMAD